MAITWITDSKYKSFSYNLKLKVSTFDEPLAQSASVSKVLNMCLQLKSQFFYNDLAVRKIALPWWYLQTTSWAIISSTNPNIWDDHCTICFTYNTQTMSADTETQRLEVVLSHQEMKKGKKNTTQENTIKDVFTWRRKVLYLISRSKE